MIRIIKYLVIVIFVICVIFSLFVMIDNYHAAVVKGISQTIICDEIVSNYQGTSQTRTLETCFTYNPQLLFYGQFIIIAILAISFRYLYKLSIAYISRSRKLTKEGSLLHTNYDDDYKLK